MSLAVQLTLYSSWLLTGRRSAPGELSSSPHYLQLLTCSGKGASGRQVLRMAWTTTARQGVKFSLSPALRTTQWKVKTKGRETLVYQAMDDANPHWIIPYTPGSWVLVSPTIYR